MSEKCERWMKNNEGWMMKDDDFKLLRGFADGQANERTDICDCRVAFATENWFSQKTWILGFVQKWVLTIPGELVKM